MKKAGSVMFPRSLIDCSLGAEEWRKSHADTSTPWRAGVCAVIIDDTAICILAACDPRTPRARTAGRRARHPVTKNNLVKYRGGRIPKVKTAEELELLRKQPN
jgi:hypothetical protein